MKTFGTPTHNFHADNTVMLKFSSSLLLLQMDKLDPMQNQLCRVCDEPAAGFHFGAFTCEGCKSFFGRTCNNQSVIQECKNNYRCVINKKNRTACKACRLRKCLMVGMSKSGSRYGRRSNWFKIHCLMQQAAGGQNNRPSSNEPRVAPPPPPPPASSTLTSTSSPTLWRPLDSPSPNKPSSPPAKVQSPTPIIPMNFLKKDPPVDPPMSTSSPMVPSTTAPFTFPSLYSPFSSPGLPFIPPTFNLPGLSALPLHKQALLSPLLASSHFLAAARLAATPASTTPERQQSTDVLAEHKALLERFRASAAALAAATAMNNNKEDLTEKEDSPVQPNNPVDLSKRSDSDSVSSVGSEIIPHLSDTDEEEETTKPNETKEMPLDLTCV